MRYFLCASMNFSASLTHNVHHFTCLFCFPIESRPSEWGPVLVRFVPYNGVSYTRPVSLYHGKGQPLGKHCKGLCRLTGGSLITDTVSGVKWLYWPDRGLWRPSAVVQAVRGSWCRSRMWSIHVAPMERVGAHGSSWGATGAQEGVGVVLAPCCRWNNYLTSLTASARESSHRPTLLTRPPFITVTVEMRPAHSHISGRNTALLPW